MKKLLLFASIALVAACQNSNTEFEESTLELGEEVTFMSSIASQTRVSDNSFDVGDQIVVSAMDGSEIYAESIIYTYDGTIFSSTTPISHKSGSSELSYMAAYPSIDNLAEEFAFEPLADQSTATNYELSDLLVASIGTTSESCPELTFAHSMSNLVMTISEGATGGNLKVFAQPSAAINIANDQCVAMGSTTEFTPCWVDSSSAKVILAPQTISAGTTVASYELDGTTYNWVAANDISFASGYRYTCTWELNPESGYSEVTFNSYIEEWIDDEITGGFIEDEKTETITLSEISADNIPEGDTWVITDTTAISTDFAGFSDALAALGDSGREISVEFPNIEAIPAYAIFGVSAYSYSLFNSLNSDALVSIKADVATSVGTYAFYCCSNLRNVEIPEVTSIEIRAFNACSSIPEINLSKVVTIGNFAFYACTQIETLDMPQLSAIGINVFDACSGIKSVNAPQAASIGNYAFRSCTSLESIEAPLVASLGNYAFYGCSAITSIELPSAISFATNSISNCGSLTSLELATNEGAAISSINAYMFGGSSPTWIDLTVGATNSPNIDGNTITVNGVSLQFKSITMVDGDGNIYEVKNYTLSEISAENIPEDDTWIITDTTATSESFAGLSAAIEALSESGREISLEFPNLESIPDYAMYGDNAINYTYNATALASIKASAATSVGEYAFQNAISLANIELPAAKSIGGNAFYRCLSLESIELPAATSIGTSSFSSCSALTSFDAPLAATIGNYAFASCSLLSDINIPSATTIGSSAFSSCTIEGVDMPLVTSIGDFAFSYCSALKSVVLPSAVTVNSYSFNGCSALETLEIATASGCVIETLSSSAFSDNKQSEVDLTVGTANSEMIDGATITVGSSSTTYKSITTVDTNGNVVDSSDDDILMGAFTLDLFYATEDNIVISVTPNNEYVDCYYTYGFATESDYSIYYSSNPSNVMENYLNYFNDLNIDFETANDVIIFNGEGLISLTDYWAPVANTTYIIVVAAVDADGNMISDPKVISAKTSGSYTSSDANYNQWIGDWSVTSTGSYSGGNISFDVTIEANIQDKNFLVTGWDLSIARNYWGYRTDFDAESGNMVFNSPSFITYADAETMGSDGYMCGIAVGECASYPTGVMLSSSYSAMTVAMNSDNTATGSPFSATLTNGETFTFTHMFIGYRSGTSVSKFSYETDYSSGNDPKAPYTMVRKSTTSSQSPRYIKSVNAMVPQMISREILSAARIECRYSPLSVIR